MVATTDDAQLAVNERRAIPRPADAASLDVIAIQRLQRNLGLTDAEVLRVLDVAPPAHGGRQRGLAASEQRSRERLCQLEALDLRLQKTFEAESVMQWLRQSNRYLGGRTPLELMLAGRIGRVDAALEALDSGVFI